MLNPKATAAVMIGLALLLGWIGFSLRPHAASTIHSIASPTETNAGPANAASALHDTIAHLQAEQTRLMQELEAANAENAQLEKAKGQTIHAVVLYKELTAQSQSQNLEPTNSYPTPRHFMVGIGKQARLLDEAQNKWGDLDSPDPEKQSEDEKRAMGQAMMVLVSEQFRLQRAVENMKENGWGTAIDEASSETLADYVTCYLYGALNLKPDQFYRANDLLQQYYKQAEQKGLLFVDPEEGSANSKFNLPRRRETYTPDPDPRVAASEQLVAFIQLNENARAEVESLLSAEQKDLFKGSTLKDLRLVGGTFSPPDMLNGAIAHYGAQAPSTEPRP